MDEKPVSFEQKIENEIVEKGLGIAPRVTKEQVDALLKKLSPGFAIVNDTRVLCQLSLDGFIVAEGFYDCTSKANFDQDMGCRIAHHRACLSAHLKLWELEGYRLSRELNKNAGGETASTILNQTN